MFKKHRAVYIINKVAENKFQVCKVLNEYSSKEQSNEELLKLLTKKVNENDLLEKFDIKEL